MIEIEKPKMVTAEISGNRWKEDTVSRWATAFAEYCFLLYPVLRLQLLKLTACCTNSLQFQA